MTQTVAGWSGLAVAIAVGLTPAPSDAMAPLLLMMVKQIAQQAATSMIKDTLLSSLSGLGCKGIALSNALAAFDLRSAAGGGAGMLAGMTRMPTVLPGMTMPSLPAGAGLALGSVAPGAGIPPDMAARMNAMVPGAGQLPSGVGIDPDTMARMQQAMSQPLSPPETLATIDALSELGLLSKPMLIELKECMVLVPAAAPALGMGMGMLKPMIPQLRQAREQLHALSPAEQDEVAAALTQEMKSLSADDRTSFVETLDSGFFPPRISGSVKAALLPR